ncbi:MAG: hypothetical protein V4482_00350 [Pseudomonadota bacterium]
MVILITEYMKIFICANIVAILISATHSFACDYIQEYHAKRCIVFNTVPDFQNSMVVDGEVIEKSDVLCEYTMEIDDFLIDLDDLIAGRMAAPEENECVFKAIMGSWIVDKRYEFDKDDLPILSEESPFFRHFEVIRLVNDLSQVLMMKVRQNGYQPIDIRYLACYGNAYTNLFTYSGVKREMYARWFNEVFMEHESGFRLANPSLRIRRYDPLEPVITELALSQACIKGILKSVSAVSRAAGRLRHRVNFCSELDESNSYAITSDEILAVYLGDPLKFRANKPNIAGQGNTRGNLRSNALGRKFGNPNADGITKGEKEAAVGLIRAYLDARKATYSVYCDRKIADYTEADWGEEDDLSSEAITALYNMDKNVSSGRF